MFVNFHRKLAFVALKDSELLWRIFFYKKFREKLKRFCITAKKGLGLGHLELGSPLLAEGEGLARAVPPRSAKFHRAQSSVIQEVLAQKFPEVVPRTRVSSSLSNFLINVTA